MDLAAGVKSRTFCTIWCAACTACTAGAASALTSPNSAMTLIADEFVPPSRPAGPVPASLPGTHWCTEIPAPAGWLRYRGEATDVGEHGRHDAPLAAARRIPDLLQRRLWRVPLPMYWRRAFAAALRAGFSSLVFCCRSADSPPARAGV